MRTARNGSRTCRHTTSSHTRVESTIAALPPLDPLGRLSLETSRDELASALDDESSQPAHAART